MKRIVAAVVSLLFVLVQNCSVVWAEESIEEPVLSEVAEEVIIDPEPEPEPEPELIEPPQVVINEILADPEESDAENEFIELYNAGSQAVDLLGWQLDDARADDGAFVFGAGILLEPDSYLVLYRPETGITLNNDTDEVHLFDSEGNEMDTFTFGVSFSGYSWGRNPENGEEWVTFKTPTPGSLNILEENALPVALIDVQQDTALMKLNVTGENSYDPDGDGLSFLWEFEEGVFDERENPLMYEYLESGEKVVRLTVTDIFGGVGEAELVFVAEEETEEEPLEPDPEPEPEPEPTDLPLVYINEVLADPVEEEAENEFIELYNAGSQAVDLLGWQLDDARVEDDPYVFDNEEIDYVLEPDSYLVLFRPETGIVLNNDVESVVLLDVEGRQVDLVEFESPGAGKTWGRGPEVIEEWMSFKTPTPGSVNIIEPNNLPVAMIEVQKDTAYMKLNVTGAGSYDPDGDRLSFLWEFEEGVFDERENPLIYEYQVPGEKLLRLVVTDEFGASAEAELLFVATERSSGGGGGGEVVERNYPTYSLINEVMPAPDGKDDENEWVELYNASGADIDLSGWYLDDAEGKSSPFKISEGTILSPYAFKLFSEPGLGLSFKNSEDTVRLLNPNKQVGQQVNYVGVQENWSYAKNNAGQFEWTPLFTPGYDNDFPPPPKSYKAGSVVFESVLPNPEGEDSGNEAVVLGNRTSEDIALMGWAMSDASDAVRALPDLVLPAGASLSLLSSEFKLSLNNSNESLSLFDPVGNLIDQIKWKNSASGSWLFNPDSLKNGMMAEVVRTVDGDTLVIAFDDKKLTVRLIGVDTPETVHPFKPIEYYGKQASSFLADRLSGQTVRLEFDENKIDKYGRVLAYVYEGDTMINREILELGYGYAYTRFPFWLLEEFVTLEEAAREARMGLWQNLKVTDLIEKMIEEELSLEEDGELLEEDLLLLLEEELEEVEEEGVVEEVEEEEVVEMPDCSSEFLKIDRFLPNPQKGEAVEYIRLINMGKEKVCLNGWVLDDVADGGSKPFAIRGGAIAAAGVRNFRKQETRLALNNSNDCVNLIAPDGTLVDQICYEKTHKNEIFTHAGGDWVPKPKAKKTKKAAGAAARFSFKRDFISYQSELPAILYVGKVVEVDEQGESLVLELEVGERVQVSYANSPIDFEASRQLIDVADSVEVQVYEAGAMKSLVSIKPFGNKMGGAEGEVVLGLWLWIFILLLPVFPLLYLRRKF